MLKHLILLIFSLIFFTGCTNKQNENRFWIFEYDILITDGGPVILTEMCPKTIDEIESVVGTSN